jgi:hypothetical protein
VEEGAKRVTRRRKIIFWALGATVAAVGGLAIAVVLSTPKPVDLSLDAEVKEIPSGWLEDGTTAAPAESGEPESSGAEASVSLEPDAESAPRVFTGRLAIVGDGKPFGEEAYELTISGDRTVLRSTGRFWFKVVLATIQVTFEQTFEADGSLRPTLYAADFAAPLGFDRSVLATVDDDRVMVEGSDGAQEIRIDPGETFTLGTFSTYALLPRLFALRSDEGSASFEVLVFGGPPNRGDEDVSDLPTMTVERMGTAALVADGVLLDVDCYLVTSDLGESELYAYGEEFLAFRSTGEDGSLWVYRSDFFPEGVDVVGVTSFW